MRPRLQKLISETLEGGTDYANLSTTMVSEEVAQAQYIEDLRVDLEDARLYTPDHKRSIHA